MDVLSLEKLGDGVDRIIAQINHHTEKGLGVPGQGIPEPRFPARGRLSHVASAGGKGVSSQDTFTQSLKDLCWGAIMRLPASSRSGVGPEESCGSESSLPFLGPGPRTLTGHRDFWGDTEALLSLFSISHQQQDSGFFFSEFRF